MDNNEKTEQVAKNTTFLYIRMLLVMFISLFSVRIVLNALGVIDYGIFNVIAGVVVAIGALSRVLSSATQRYYSIYLAKEDVGNTRNIFSVSLTIYFLFSAFLILIGETILLYLINQYLDIPADRLYAANWLYHFTLFSFVATMLQIPFLAAIIANEDIKYFTVVSIGECLLKFLAALLIGNLAYDKLIYYGLFLFIIAGLVSIIYMIIAVKKYSECRYTLVKDKRLYIDLIAFSGWSFFGSIASVGISQINTILVNMFFGPIVNAARAIAFQINAALNSFTSGLVTAIKAPIIKAYALGDNSYLDSLFYTSNKFIYYLMLLFCLPMMFEMELILQFWLNVSDNQTVLFSRLMLCYAMIMSLNNPISIIIQATGYVKQYHLSVESFTLLCAPVTYLFFKLGFPAFVTFIVIIVAALLSHIVRLICLKKYYPSFSYRIYVFQFIVPALIVSAIAITSLVLKNLFISDVYTSFITSLFISTFTVLIGAYIIALSSEERKYLRKLILKR